MVYNGPMNVSMSILRTWTAVLAGVNRMTWRRFLFFNAAGGIGRRSHHAVEAETAGRLTFEGYPSED